MSKEEADKLLEELKDYVAETTSSPEKARAALIAAGLVKEDGQPEEIYQD